MSSPQEASAQTRPVLSIGRYVLYGEIASGGMATVHFGRIISDGGFSRTVAIKRMRRDIARDPEFVAMFLDEAHLSSRIEHPNVVRVLDVVAEEDEVFLVMEYVRGESLERLRRKARKRKQPVPVPVAVNIMYGVLAGLHAAHEAVGEDGKPLGIVHRDVSPPNILVSEEGVARITDFGIAKAESRLQTTQDGQMKGKIPYMAPEQLTGEQIDRRIDVFAAGVVLWELLASKFLFRGDHPGETIAKILKGPIPLVDSVRSDVPHELALCVQKALNRNPEKRFSTAEEFADAIEEAMDGRLGSRKKVGAWVKSLAREELEQRSSYVRQMESTSWNRLNKGELLRDAPRTGSSVRRLQSDTGGLPGSGSHPGMSGSSSKISAATAAPDTGSHSSVTGSTRQPSSASIDTPSSGGIVPPPPTMREIPPKIIDQAVDSVSAVSQLEGDGPSAPIPGAVIPPPSEGRQQVGASAAANGSTADRGDSIDLELLASEPTDGAGGPALQPPPAPAVGVGSRGEVASGQGTPLFGSELSGSSPGSGGTGSSGQPARVLTPEELLLKSQQERRKKLGIAGGVAGGLLILFILIFALFSGGDDSEEGLDAGVQKPAIPFSETDAAVSTEWLKGIDASAKDADARHEAGTDEDASAAEEKSEKQGKEEPSGNETGESRGEGKENVSGRKNRRVPWKMRRSNPGSKPYLPSMP